MSAASRPYSSRSWPSSAVGNFSLAIFRNLATASGDGMDVLLRKRGRKLSSGPNSIRELRRRAVQGRSDVAEDCRDRTTGRGHRGHRDERDERHEQRVLEEVLTFFVTDERLHGLHELHWVLLDSGKCG